MVSFRDCEVEQVYGKNLSKSETAMLPYLLDALKLIDEIYKQQENDSYAGANFYPHSSTKEELEQAFQSSAAIFSPFTIIERGTHGQLQAVEYHVKYKAQLQKIGNLLRQAVKHADNPSFTRYLSALIDLLENGHYEQAIRDWLLVKGSHIDLTLGPYERYLDKLFAIKRAYQGQIGIIDQKKTDNAKVIRDILYTTFGERAHRIIPPSIVDISVQHSLAFSGFLEKVFFTQQHLPSDSDLMERYGSRIIVYISSIDYKFDNLIFPIFTALFENNFKSSYTKDLLRSGNYYYVLLQGLAQQLHRYRHSRDRLKQLFPIYDEANSVVAGIQHAKHLILKGVINQKELETIMIAHICWIFSEWVLSKKSNAREDYLKGDTLTLNFLCQQGALQQKDGLSWPNFAKMFFEIENLSAIFTRFMEAGTYEEAQEFLVRYLTYDFFEAFEGRLAVVKPL